jgi:hypothetical protein
MSNKLQKVERGGEVQPDKEDKGSDANVKRDEYGILESVSPKLPRQRRKNIGAPLIRKLQRTRRLTGADE